MAASKYEIEQFLVAWDMEAKNTIRVLESLLDNQYDYRPDIGGRSLGELAWHLAEIDGYTTYLIETGGLHARVEPPHLERPPEGRAVSPPHRPRPAQSLRPGDQ